MTNPFYVDPTASYDPSAMSGLGQALMQVGQQRQARQKEERAQEAQEQMQYDVMQAFESADPDVMSKTAAQYPQMANIIYKQMGINSDSQKSDMANFTRDIITASPEQRDAKFQERIAELRAKGRDPSHTEKQYLDWQANPEGEIQEMTAFYAGVDSKGYEALKDMTPDAAGQAKAQRDERSINVREQELALKQRAEERMSTKLSAPAEKALIDAQDTVVTSQQSANKFDTLASDFERYVTDGGVTTTVSETFKNLLGSQDDVSELRREFNKVRLSEGLKNLPPGPATDRDVQEAFKGVPKESAGAEQVASFLRGAAKLSRFSAGYNQFKADAISRFGNVRNLNKQWRGKVYSKGLDEDVTVAEVYAEAQETGLAPEEVAERLGIEWDY